MADIELYDKLTWWLTWKDHAPNDDPYASLPEA
jgi:hypothetical protein